MLTALHRLALGLFRLMPTQARRIVVRSLSPTFTAGAIAVILDEDDRMLLVRQTYRGRWGLPGGLMKRGELPLDALNREVREEVGIAVVAEGEPEVVLDPEPRRIDVVFVARPAAVGPEPQPSSAEIEAMRWVAADEVPVIQMETAMALERLNAAGRLPAAWEAVAETAVADWRASVATE
jgi:8-oxo-dGTP pyrophosphatase MutT (NUDIX family)